MAGETTRDVRDLIERLRENDEAARRALLERVYGRLCRIAAVTLHGEFPRLRDDHELQSVVDLAWMRLLEALETTKLASAEEFYGLMFRKVRHVLLDLARRKTREAGRGRLEIDGGDDSNSAHCFEVGDIAGEDPAKLALWTEFHQQVDSLPESERTVFDFHYYAELPQAEIAHLMNLAPKRVSRLWLAATGRLGRWLKGLEGSMS
jgi:RNA polymerase sigma-70 factor (ECF subfamily)